MKYFLFITFFIPVCSFAQEIKCLDSVTVSGYFYRIKDNRLSPTAFTSDVTHFNFLPEYDVKNKSVFEIIRERQDAEKDTIKFLSYKPDKDLSSHINASCSAELASVINIQPFSSANKLYKVKGYKSRRVQISFVKVKWLHLKVKKNIACGGGFDRPASLFCDSSKDLWFDIYLPLEVMEINNSTQIKHGNIVSAIPE